MRLLTFTTFLLCFFVYIGIRLAEGIAEWIFLGIIFILLFSFPFLQWKYEKVAWPKLKLFVQRCIYVSMGFMSWLLILTLFRDFCLLSLYPFAGLTRVNLVAESSSGFSLFAMAIVLTLAGSWQAYYGLYLRKITIPLLNLPKGLQGFKIIHLSDLHAGTTIGHRYINRVVQMINNAKADIVVMTGDIADGRVDDVQGNLSQLSQVATHGKVFYVTGNHEYYWGVSDWVTFFKSLGIKVLLNEGVMLEHRTEKIWIAGIPDPVAAQLSKQDAPNVKVAAKGGEEAVFRLLLSHRPGIVDQASSENFHLQLSGHTHGGQFFPWTFVAKFFHEYLIGLVKHKNTWLYISPGAGSWGPPMRIGTTPEIALIELALASK